MPRITAAHEQEIRERIVVAALRVFAERGFHRATMQDIVRESRLSVGAIYTYFRSKDELFLAGCDFTSGRGLGELARRLTLGTSTAHKLAIAVGFFFDAESPDGPSMAPFLVQAWAEAETEPAVRAMLGRRREQLVTAGQMLLQEGVARGELPSWMDVEAVAFAYSALLDGLILQRLEEGPALRRATAERRARAILELAIGAAAAPDRPSIPAVPAVAFSTVPSEDAQTKAAS